MERNRGGLDPYHLHTLRQWQGAYWDGLPDPDATPQTAKLPQERLDQLNEPFDLNITDVSTEDAKVDFGDDDDTDKIDFGNDESFIQDLRDRFGDF